MIQRPKTLNQALQWAVQELDASTSDTIALDARLLLQDAVELDHVAIITRGNDPLSDRGWEKLTDFVSRRCDGEPVHRIVGWREFFGRRFEINPHTLVPRPDTETLVEAVLENARHRKDPLTILDLGTGSGVIAISLAAELAHCEVCGVDVSLRALEVARRNAESYGVDARVEFVHGDLFQPVSGRFDLIVSNPPYIASSDIDSLVVDVRQFDPRLALDGGHDGLEFYRRILCDAGSFLNENGQIGLEIGFDQGDAVSKIARMFGYQVLEVCKDLNGHDRAVMVALTQ